MNQFATMPAADAGAALYSSELSAADFREISELVRSMVGIQLTEAKQGLVKSRLQKRLRRLGMTQFSQYVAFIKTAEGAGEVEELISAISTNVTAFNREPHHFEHFRENVIPLLAKKIHSREPVRIWSAGCSNGSEPYTIACAVLDAIPNAGDHDFHILATDIDKYSLATGRQGIYTEEMVSKMPSEKAKSWFQKTNQGYEVHPKAKKLVSFKTLNLMTSWPIKRKYDAIFCRNVMIYFCAEDQARIISQFANHLYPGAFLYIGHSERVLGPAAEKFVSAGATTYQYDPKKVST